MVVFGCSWRPSSLLSFSAVFGCRLGGVFWPPLRAVFAESSVSLALAPRRTRLALLSCFSSLPWFPTRLLTLRRPAHGHHGCLSLEFAGDFSGRFTLRVVGGIAERSRAGLLGSGSFGVLPVRLLLSSNARRPDDHARGPLGTGAPPGRDHGGTAARNTPTVGGSGSAALLYSSLPAA